MPKRPAVMVGMLITYIWALVFFGLEVSTFLFLMAALKYLKQDTPLKLSLIPILVTAILYVVFKFFLDTWFPEPLIYIFYGNRRLSHDQHTVFRIYGCHGPCQMSWRFCSVPFVGIVVGILPGLGPMVGMVVLLPFSFAFSPDVALSLLLGVFCGGYFGGAVPAVLLRTPGVPSSLVTSFDGYPLTQRGEAQTALSAALLGSFGGGLISVLILIFLAPLLSQVAASFGPPEYFTVAVFGVVLVVMAFRQQLFRGIILLGLGFFLSCVGIDGNHPKRTILLWNLVHAKRFGYCAHLPGDFSASARPLFL